MTIVAAVIHRPLKKRRKILEAERDKKRASGYDENLLSAEKEEDVESLDIDKPKKKKKSIKRKSKKNSKNKNKINENLPEPNGNVPEP